MTSLPRTRSCQLPSARKVNTNFAESPECELRLNGVLGGSGALGLAQEAGGIVSVPPVLDDLAIRDAEHVDGPNLHPLASRSDPLKLSPVGPAHDNTGRHPVPFGHHVLDGDAEVGEPLSGLGEGLLEGIDELGRRVVWE